MHYHKPDGLSRLWNTAKIGEPAVQRLRFHVAWFSIALELI